MKVYVEYYDDIPAKEYECKFFKISSKSIMLVDKEDNTTYLPGNKIQKFTVYDVRE